jgi:purine-nucleoside phosphorylase
MHVTSMDLDRQLSSAFESLQTHIPERYLSPKIGIVCGSGLSTLGDSIRDKYEVPYSSLDGFGHSSGEDLLLFLFIGL